MEKTEHIITNPRDKELCEAAFNYAARPMAPTPIEFHRLNITLLEERLPRLNRPDRARAHRTLANLHNQLARL